MDTFVRTKVSATRRATAEKKDSTSCKLQRHKIKNLYIQKVYFEYEFFDKLRVTCIITLYCIIILSI
ncbi:MAG: hypothetical protein R3Y09_12570 [Clostridia bacterium]